MFRSLDQEVRRVNRPPFRPRRIAAPVGECAVGELVAAQARKHALDVAVDILQHVRVALHDRRQVELREGARGDLLDAAVGISHQVFEAPRKVYGRDRRKFQLRLAVLLERFYRHCLARVDDIVLRQGHIGVRFPDVQLDFRRGAVARRRSRDPYLPDAGSLVDLQAERYDLLAAPAERDALAGRPDGRERFVRGDFHVDFPDPVFEGEDRDRNLDLFIGGNYAGHGGLHQQRFFHRDILFRGAERPAVRGDHHHPNLAEVGRERDFVRVRLPGSQLLCVDEPYDGLESLRFERPRVGLLGVAADGEHLFDPAAIGADDIVEHVPRADAQCLGRVEITVRVGGFEARQSQQPLVDERQHVAHFPAVFLPDFYRHLRFGFYRFGHLDHGGEPSRGVLDVEPRHAEQADRCVVERRVVGLEECYRDIDVGGHPLLDGDFDVGLLAGALHPEAFPHDAAAFDADQRPCARRRGDGDPGLVPRDVFGLVAGEGEPRGGIRHRSDVAPPIGRGYAYDPGR